MSDLHFGRLNEDLVEKLLEFIHKPDHDIINLVVVSGDLTQRARSKQFIAAAEFLKKVKKPVLAVPGNHDVPLFNMFKRFFRPFKGYDTHIAPLAAHFFEDDEMFVHGLRTNNIFTVKDGRVSRREVEALETRWKNPEVTNKLKVLVGHHPIFDKKDHSSKKTTGLLKKIMELGPHWVLFGHEHQSRATWYDEANAQPPVLVGAGTGTSSRLRQEANSVNLITWDPVNAVTSVKVFVYESVVGRFELANEKRFQFESL